MAITEKNLVRAVEVWAPSEDGKHLKLMNGAYGSLQGFKEASKDYQFALGEGLPGLCWQNKTPLILHNLFTSDFQRAEAARQAGLTSGIGIPTVRSGEVTGVLVLLCDDGAGAQGAFEVWDRSDRDELALQSNYYANLTRFGTVSQYVRFPRGSGLPGQVWEQRFPKIIHGLGKSPTFMRGAGAAADGLDVGVALPVMRSEHDLESVVLMLSSARSPIAQAFEVWTTNESESQMQLHSGRAGAASTDGGVVVEATPQLLQLVVVPRFRLHQVHDHVT